ncbi:MAG: hypothetical protein EA398_11015 [Deltaproteobacteria bacterium]|nr:MAG: hypothetical protein EA398_11015 [Deltaproteobacteria bacterium]
MADGAAAFHPEHPFAQVSYLIDGTDVFALEYRLRRGDDWSAWDSLEITWNEEQAAVGRLFLDDPALAFEVRGPEGAVDFASFEFHEEIVADPDVLTRNLPVEVEDKSASLPGFVVTRAQWGARNPGRLCGSAHTPRRLTVHHTVTPNNDSLTPAARMRQIQAFHIDGRGWCDVGYHFMVGIDGRVYEGRNNWMRTGAHVRVANRDNVGINLVGNFMSFEPRTIQMEGAARIIAWVADRHGFTINRVNVRGHQEFMATDCPGVRLQARLGELVDRARAVQGGGAQPPPPQPEPAGRSLVGFVREGNINAEDRPVAGASVRTAGNRSTTTDANGFYRFDDVPVGNYRVTASADGFATAETTRIVDTSASTFYASIALQPETRTTTVVGFVREGSINADDRPVAGAAISTDGGLTATTDTNGFYRLEGVPLGSVRVTAAADGFTTASVTRSLGAAGTVYYASIALEREPAPTPPGLDVPIDDLDRMAIAWERLGDGSWKFLATTPDNVRSVTFIVDGQTLPTSTDRSDSFDSRWRPVREGLHRDVEAIGFDAGGQPVAWAMGVLDATEAAGVFVRQTGPREFEIGIERAPWAARFLEVIVDGFTLTDRNTGLTRSDRQAVRYRFQTLGERTFVLNTYNSDGSYRGTFRRTVELR